MIYQRTQEFFAAHFNENAYAKLAEIDSWPDYEFDINAVHALLSDIHGHNFKATVRIEGDITSDANSSYLISDEAIVETINEWHGTNLSVHKDFRSHNIRATTENMAEILAIKIGRKLLVNAYVTVTIHESSDIFAEYSSTFTM